MADTSSFWDRLAVIIELVSRAPGQVLGRTAVVKLLYFLQVVRKVPLGYDFRLHTYGPFDSDVLDDLGYAHSLGAISSKVVPYPAGYGYEIRRGSKAGGLQDQGDAFLSRYRDEICRVIGQFGSRTASDLELLSTIIYVDRELACRDEQESVEKIVRMVHEIKRHFSTESIRAEVDTLREAHLLAAC